MTRNGAEAGLNLFTYLVRSWQYYRLVHHEPSSALLIFLLVKEMQISFQNDTVVHWMLLTRIWVSLMDGGAWWIGDGPPVVPMYYCVI